MKKILVLLLATAMLFASIGCSNGNGSDSSSGTGNEVENGGGSGTGAGDKENEAGGSSTSDYTKTVSVSDFKLSDGEWTVSMNATADFMNEEMKLEATVKNGAYKFTSGKGSITVDMEKVFELMGDEIEMPAAAIEQFKNLPDEQKNAMLESMGEGEGIPEGYKMSWDGLILNVEATASDKDLAEMDDFLTMPDDAKIKTNADKTKYKINYSEDDDEAGTLNVEIIIVKNN